MGEFQIYLLRILTCHPSHPPQEPVLDFCSVNQNPHNAASPFRALGDFAGVNCLLPRDRAPPKGQESE